MAFSLLCFFENNVRDSISKRYSRDALLMPKEKALWFVEINGWEFHKK
jgi:hypothetical protein